MHRLYLTKRERAALLETQGGVCCVRGCGSLGPLIGEHSTPNVWERAKPDQLMCEPCHKIKTLRDMKNIAKVKRLNGVLLSQYERRKIYGPTLRSRSFDRRR